MSDQEHRITASGDELVKRATEYMAAALRRLHEDFDKGKDQTMDYHFTEESIAAYMQTTAIDCASAIIAQQIGSGLADIAAAIREQRITSIETTIHGKPIIEEVLNILRASELKFPGKSIKEFIDTAEAALAMKGEAANHE